jgi:hypothetical protein
MDLDPEKQIGFFMIGIYKITSPSDRIYIGQSINIERRFNQYKRMQNVSEQKGLYNSFKKHGVYNHEFIILEICDIENLNKQERYWQDYYNVINNGLNCVLTNTSELKRVFSEETRLKMSISAKKKFFSESHRKNIGLSSKRKNLKLSFKGFKHTEETKKKLSERQIGSLNHNYNKKASTHTRELMSSKTKGELNPMFGKKQSDETKLKIQKNRTKNISSERTLVLDTQTGIFYKSIKEASIYNSINYKTLFAQIKGRNPNKTNLIIA